jgi:hypothetical protein
MKYLIAIAIISTLYKAAGYEVSYPQGQSQPVKAQWESTKNWRLYKLHNFNQVFRTPTDSLKYLQSKPLSDDSMHLLLISAKEIGDTNPAWQGCYLASYQTANGDTRKAIISHYAGFFYCQSDNAYFQVSPTVQRDWLEYLSESYVDIDRASAKQ